MSKEKTMGEGDVGDLVATVLKELVRSGRVLSADDIDRVLTESRARMAQMAAQAGPVR